MFDVVITGGEIIDGTGAPRRRGDVAIRDGVVEAIGQLDAASLEAREVIDATGRIVCPGFVDIHTHYDAQVLWDPTLSVSPAHGVTSVVIGNCGFGVAPTRPADRHQIIRTLEKVEGMSAAALEAGLGDDWGFASFPEFLDAVEAQRPLINVAALLGHTPLRLWALGEASTTRAATDDEVAAMRDAVVEAIGAGALGFATSKSTTHLGAGGRPVPSRAAELDEVLALCAPLRDIGGGVVQATVGPGLFFEEFGAIAERTGGTVSWTALLANTGEGVPAWMLGESIALQDRGLRVLPQVSCRPLQFEFTFAEPFPFESMPEFAPVSAAADDRAKLAVYGDPVWRAELRRRFADGRTGALQASWDRTVIAAVPGDPSLEERTVAEAARSLGVDATELALDLAVASGLQARFRLAAYNYDDDEVAPLLASDRTVLGLSDAGAHASQLCDACFSTHLLGHWVRDRGTLTLEEAVHKLTAQAADAFGLVGRGRLVERAPADVVVFDPATVAAGPLRRVHDLPAGQDRLVADAVGIDAVLVRGTVVARHGSVVDGGPGERPGRVLRNGRA